MRIIIPVIKDLFKPLFFTVIVASITLFKSWVKRYTVLANSAVTELK